MRRYVLIISLCLLAATKSAANQAVTLTDSARVSLLTCTPGNETYSKYGHSAVRIFDPELDIDWTFNYGVFNFNTKDFYLKFLRGETWYQLDLEDTDWFIYTSSLIGRITYEQVLNLKQEEKQAIFNALVDNYQPKKRYYLYNFVFDNCATRPYKLIRKAMPNLPSAQQVADYQAVKAANDIEHMKALQATNPLQRIPVLGDEVPPTYRQMIRHYSEKNSWPGFGIDFIFGSVADVEMTAEQRLFLPEQLMSYVGNAVMEDGTPFCLEDNTKTFEIKKHSWWTSPYLAILLLALCICIITSIDVLKHRYDWWIDFILLMAGAILGLICFYLSYFSIHPLVGKNWNLLIINPLLFIPCIMLLIPKCRHWLGKHVGVLGVCYLVLVVARLIGLQFQAWHWLIVLPLIHSIRMITLGNKELKALFSRKPVAKGGKKARIIVTLAALLIVGLLNAEPRLTVVVCVDGMNQQALSEMRGYWQQGGLRTLDEEAHESTITFPQIVAGGSETLATIVSGTTPDNHGISFDKYFSRQDRKVHSIFEDNEQKGIGTTLQVSPQSLLSPTITDEYRMHHSDRSKIYALGINPENTIILAGHAANACAWLDEKELCWATTGYYSEGLPSAADEMNIKGRINELAEQNWTPRMDINTYMHPTAKEKKQKGFSYQQKDVLRHSPVANTLVIELALDLQKKAQLGTDSHADMLLLELNVTSPQAKSDLIESGEQEDMYIRLNQDLGWLMEQLNKRIGKDKYRLIVFGKPQFGEGTEALKKANLRTGYFNTERAAALCNTYLMAMYGHERWIDGGYGYSIYLNRTLIEQKKMRLSDIQRQVSSFLLEFEGTKSAFSITDLPLLPSGGEEEKLRQSLNKRTAGDVVFCLQPLWVVGENENKTIDRVPDERPVSPLMIWTTELGVETEKEMSATKVKELILK